MEIFKKTTSSAEETISFAKEIGKRLRGGEVLVLKSDLGGGKTTFTRGLVEGFGSDDPVASPSFTISYVYGRSDGQQVHHFDFYRLNDPGVVGVELAESVGDESIVTVIEWGDIVENVLPEESIEIEIASQDDVRNFTIKYPSPLQYLLEGVNK